MKNKEYTRRGFIKFNSYAGLMLTGISMTGGSCTSSISRTGEISEDMESEKISLDLHKLREEYNELLFDRFIPNMGKYVIDRKYGGFMTNVDIRTGKQLATDKRAWYEGRGIWVYAFLYNNFEKDPGYLDIARKSKDFIMKHRPSGRQF